MVLVGRGGLRLHEDVFLVGVRLKGRRAEAEEKAEAALDHALGECLKAEQRLRMERELWGRAGRPVARPPA